MPPSDPTAWQQENLANIVQRLRGLVEKPNGLLDHRSSSLSRALIVKVGHQIHLFFVDADSAPNEPELSAIMSRIDLRQPLHLLAAYSQAMLLCLAWQPQPERVAVLGFGGGRLSMLLHHCFPDLLIECAEIDFDVLDLSKLYFGIKLDQRLRVALQDGRQFLAAKPAVSYDFILLDCFSSKTGEPRHLATAEFYELCRTRLRPGGVVAANFLGTDPECETKLWTFARAFDNVWRFAQEGSHVLFAADGIEIEELTARARTLEARHRLSFLLSAKAEALRRFDRTAGNNEGRNLEILTDASVQAASLQAGPPLGPAPFARTPRNDRCPCGSGKKFKHCHGR